jgi:ribose 5-phosphate isomerase B
MIEDQLLIAIGSDHAGFCLKQKIISKFECLGYSFKDFGTHSEDSVDYPDIIHPLANAVNKNVFKRGIIICGTGNGVAMTANKYSNIRAAVCWSAEVAKLARLHNNANIVSLPARIISKDIAFEIVQIFLSTEFENGRHERRVDKIPKIIT